MSVLIKGMEMPKSCDECYIRKKDTCPLTKTNVTGWGRPLNCPLVPVPPHGRLIDADALVSVIAILQDKTDNAVVLEQMRYIADDMQTVIPAEEVTT